jgi:hypothetical protein
VQHRARTVFDCRMTDDLAMMSSMILRRLSGNTFKGIALLLLLSCGVLFGSETLENGPVPIIAILGFAAAALLFWSGEKLNP